MRNASSATRSASKASSQRRSYVRRHMPLGRGGNGAAMPSSPAEAHSNLVGSPQRPVPLPFALTGVGKAITMAAQKVSPGPMKLDDAPPAGDSVHDTGTDEIRPRAAKPAGDADDADGLLHVFPVAAGDAHPIGEMQPVFLGTQIDRRHLLAVAGPLPAAPPSMMQAALLMQPIHVDGAAGLHRIAPQVSRPSRSDTAIMRSCFSEIV